MDAQGYRCQDLAVKLIIQNNGEPNEQDGAKGNVSNV